MSDAAALLAIVDRTLGTLFTPDRSRHMRSPIFARVEPGADCGWFECTVIAPGRYAAELLEALEAELSVRKCKLRINPL